MNYSIEAVKVMGEESELVFEVKGLYQALSQVTDRRNRRGVRYSLAMSLTLLVFAKLAGVVVTGDALFTQQNLSQQIVEAGADYLWLVKDNQPSLRQAIERLFAPEFCLPGSNQLKADFLTARQIDKAHGRLEQRFLTT